MLECISENITQNPQSSVKSHKALNSPQTPETRSKLAKALKTLNPQNPLDKVKNGTPFLKPFLKPPKAPELGHTLSGLG